MDFFIKLFFLLLGTWFYMTERNERNDVEHKYILDKFSTKTPYRNAYWNPAVSPATDDLHHCNLVFINGLFRHGTRAPGKKDFKKIANLQERLKSVSSYRLPALAKLQSHRFILRGAGPKELLPVGYQELFGMGRRYGQSTRSSFALTPENTKFFSSSITRCMNSTMSFMYGLFNHSGTTDVCANSSSAGTPFCGWSAQDPVTESIVVDNFLLRFFDNCARYAETVSNNASSIREYYNFLSGPTMQGVLDDVTNDFNLQPLNLSTADIRTAYLACGYETAANIKKDTLSPWCQFFRPNHFTVLEYLADLKHYWRKAYGHQLNYLPACPLLEALLQQLQHASKQHSFLQENKLKPTNHQRAAFWFGHAETIFPIISLLGLFNETPSPTAEGFAARSQDKVDNNFRGSGIAPFAGNLAFRLYHCPKSARYPRSSGYHVQISLNEHPIRWPEMFGAADTSHIPLSSLLERLNHCSPESFNFVTYCSYSPRKHN